MAPNLISLTQLLAGQNEGDIIGREILATQSPLLGSVKGPPPPPPPLGQDSRPLVLPLAAAAAGRFLCPNSTTEGFPSPSSCCNLLGVACRQIPMESFKQENGADGLGRGQSFPSQPLLTPGPVGQTGQAGRPAGRQRPAPPGPVLLHPLAVRPVHKRSFSNTEDDKLLTVAPWGPSWPMFRHLLLHYAAIQCQPL